jgi:ABC-type phosphate/phosphonate transport system substrate-binding protein
MLSPHYRACTRTALLALSLASGLGFYNTTSAELIFTAPPRESVEDGNRVYEPLAKALSQLLGETVTYRHPGDWHNYQKQLKDDAFDIVFDGPHFAAWRMDALGATPLVRLPGSLSFVLVTFASYKGVSKPEDLIGMRVCTLPSPNLGALSLYSMFPNPVLQPDFLSVSGGFRQVANKLFAGECHAAILRSAFYYQKLTPKERDLTKVIQETPPIVNQGITVSRRVDEYQQIKMMQALTTSSGAKAMRPLLDRFASSENSFIPTQKEEYVGQNLLRDNTMFGW